MNASEMNGKEILCLNRRAFLVWWKSAPMLFVSAAASELIKALTPYVSIFFLAKLIDEITGPLRKDELIRYAVMALLGTGFMTLAGKALLRWKKSLQETLYYRCEGIFMKKLLSMDFAAADDPHTHELDSRIRQNQDWGNWGFLRMEWHFRKAVSALGQICGAVALSVSLFTLKVPEGSRLSVLNHPLFLTAMLLIMGFITVLSPVIYNQTGKYWVRYTDMATFSNRISTFFEYTLVMERERSMEERIYRQERFTRKAAVEHSGFTEKSQIAKWARGPMGMYAALSAGLSRLFTVAVYLFVCLKAWGGAFGVGAVTQYISAVTSLAGGVSSLLSVLGDMKNNAAYLKMVFELLDIPNEMYQGSLSVEKRTDRNYEVEFRDVSFRYPHMEAWALRHVSLKFKVRERLAVVGQNGSGKTTMIKLLCRLYDPTEGEILLNGIDIRKYNYAEYLNLFSVVFQDFQLLAYGLGQNVAGSSRYDAERVKACLQDAGLSERLSSMPKGLDTCIGREFDRESAEISGGEAQKVAIARALYKDAPFIVLDEPTAALDPVSEAEIYSGFDTLIQDKTAIYISHRLSSCRFCDQIAVFDQGQVVQFGSHSSLVAQKGGKYYELWQAQAQYYT